MDEYLSLPSYRGLVEECRLTGDDAPLHKVNRCLADIDAQVAEMQARFAAEESS